MRSLLLLCGRKRTGKGSVYNIVNACTVGAGEFFFAKPIKDFCINALGLTHDQMYGASEHRESPTRYQWGWVSNEIRERYGKKPEEFLTAREVLQVVGTDVMRDHFYQRVWADAGVFEALRSNATTCVFTDVRMVNEIEAACDIVKLAPDFDKPLIVRLYRETGLVDTHRSETELDIYDAVPNQRSIKQGIPKGFDQITDELFIRVENNGNPFDYILDNNGDIGTLETNVSILRAIGPRRSEVWK